MNVYGTAGIGSSAPIVTQKDKRFSLCVCVNVYGMCICIENGLSDIINEIEKEKYDDVILF